MILNKIRLKNFYSYKNQELDLDNYKNEIVVIKGRNGAGKSTLFEAIIWGIFGKTIRKSTEDAIVNTSERKNCEVELHLDNGAVTILRGKKPNKLIFKVRGKNLTKDTVTATQSVISKYYNIDYKTFLASMVFGQHSDVDFLNVSAEDKRTIIRNFLALDDIFSLRDLIRKFKSQYSSTTKTKEAIILEHEGSISSINSKLVDLENKRNNSKFDDSLATLSMEEVLSQEKKHNEDRAALINLQMRHNSLDSEVEDLTSIIEFGTKEVEITCRTCKNKSKSSRTKKEIQELSLLKEDKLNSLEVISLDEQALFSSIVEPRVKSKDLSNFLEFKELIAKEELLEEQKEELLEKIEIASKDKNESSAAYNIMRFWERAFSEQGLIKYVIKNILEYFNSQCNYYLSYLTKGNFLIEFDESLNETITIDGQPVRYYSLSGGEKRKVSFSVLLGLKSLLALSGKEESSILFVDEVAENLDTEGLEGLWNLLQELKSKKTIFLITHDKTLKIMFDSCKRISVIKENNFSRIY